MPLIGTSGLAFGVTDESYGLLESLTITETTEEAQARDGGGDVVGASFYGNTKTCEGTYLFLSATSAPTAQVGSGTAVTFSDSDASGNWYVMEASVQKSGTDFKKVSFSAKQYPDLGS